MKILLLDIETAPHLAHVWGLWQQNVGLPQIIEAGYILCWSAKWLGSDEVYFESIQKSRPRTMLKKIHSLLDEADVVIHYNGTKFDIPTLNKEFLIYELTPPAPYKQLDLYKVARKTFKFPSNKLDYLLRVLKIGKKVEHKGHELWKGCMDGDPKAWEIMEEYNKADVTLLEEVYNKLKPWTNGPINYSVFTDNGLVCPHCGSTHYVKRGYYTTNNCKYQRYVCRNTLCGRWFRGTTNIGPKAGEKFTYVN